ncbi:DUF2520 domain-containing protein [Budviciaceae bacterium BWR-B9]|uniref:DUF2520 domain-containing protein n=1 Tax=Limnobaculum allomyrinae TaxID=2791986 RepID=A0ABS1IL12_9GAMM|nr:MULTISPECIES: Rossmann-like and DUF2520 domain-containing protein [Limnobaculum]MBK5142287.1 DUF2520 domain-containing protein [Limnobaculum allomyrinae]MBV7690828.1 DUF2520 domain-containing protein [Limnobaculum sp. M2-1]
MNIGFIGAGKVGFTLGKYFASRGINVVGYYSRNPQDARDAAKFTGSQFFSQISSLLQVCDTLFLTVPDTVITTLWQELKPYPIAGKNICHCSGALSSSVFDGIEQYNAYGYSIHPIYAIHDKFHSVESLPEVYFTVEGSQTNLIEITTLIESLGNSVRTMSAENKALYHAASVMVSNLVIGLTKMSSDIFQQCGFDRTFSDKAWNALFLGNAENICSSGMVNALTGPLERGDVTTIRQHLKALGEQERDIYLGLSRVLLKVAKQKNPDRDYSLIEAELKQ